MAIGTPRLHQQNVELFERLNQELKSLQGQVGSGKADLKLSENLYDISKLSAAEERKSENTGLQVMNVIKYQKPKTKLEFNFRS